MKKTGCGVLFLFLSFFFSFLIAEGVVRIFKSQLTFAEAQKLSLRCFAKDDHLPFVLKKNGSCNMSDYYSEFTGIASMNSLGYRGKEFSIEKPETTKRILILGDSFTFGVGVNNDETYAAFTEKFLHEKGFTDTDVINAGYANAYSPDTYYVYLKDRGFALHPDAVVMGFFVWNDISDLTETVWEKTDDNGLPLLIHSCCRIVEGDLYRHKDIPFKFAYPIVRESQFFQLLVNSITKMPMFKEKFTSNAVRDKYPGCALVPSCIERLKNEEEKMYTVINGIKKMTDAQDIPFIIMLIPADYQFDPNATAKYGNVVPLDTNNKNFIQKRLTEKFTDLSIPVLDLLPILESSASAGTYPFFVNDGHFSVAGNQITGETLSQYLIAHILNSKEPTVSE